jgi:small GTP-binding protein
MIISQPPRVVLIGDASVGKTAISHRICEGRWDPNTVATVSTACYSLTRKSDGDDDVTIQIWDTAGAERYRALNSVYYHNAVGGILVFDLSSPPSFKSLDSWIEEFTSLAQPRAVIVVIGNKADLLVIEDNPAHIQPAHAASWAHARNLAYITTSAQDGTGIKELVELLFERVPQAHVSDAPSPTINLSAPASAAGKDWCCA